MIGWTLLLGAALETGLGLLAEVGFGDEARELKERLTKRGEKARRAAFDQAFHQAVEAAGDENLKPLLEHQPFREAVIAGLLDPEKGFELEAAAEEWGQQLPVHARTLRRFFSALENALMLDETWGPVLDRYQELLFWDDVVDALRQRQLDVPPRQVVSMLNAQLVGGGAIAQGAGAVAANGGSIGIGGSVLGNVIQMVIQELHVETPLPQPGPQPDELRRAYLERLAKKCGHMRLLGLETGAGMSGSDQEEDVRLESVYIHLDTERGITQYREEETDHEPTGLPLEQTIMEARGEIRDARLPIRDLEEMPSKDRRLTALEAAAR